MKPNINIVKDSFTLIFVRCVTMFVAIIQSMVLARRLAIETYGTYAQALLIISFFAPLFSFGLDNAVNYFFNKTENKKERNETINAIFTISTFVGGIGGILLIFFRANVAQYFDNIELASLMVYTAFRPLLQNLIALYQPLYISKGYTKIIAIRNLVISILQILIIIAISAFTQDLKILFIALLGLDFGQLFFLGFYLKRKNFFLGMNFSFKLFREIISYSIPLLLATLVATISINLDKLIIGNLMSVEEYALYANMAKELPFSFIAASFTTVVTPIAVKLINEKNMTKFKMLWSDYLEIGYTITWPLCVGAIITAPQLIEVLYSQKYLNERGIQVFIIYTIVAMMRFTYFGLISSITGKTKWVFIYNSFALLLNILLNYIFYAFLGMIGPPLATLFSLIIVAILFFRQSLKIINARFLEVIRIKKLLILLFEMVLTGYSVRLIGNYFIENYLAKLLFIYIGFLLVIALLKKKDLRRLIKSMSVQK